MKRFIVFCIFFLLSVISYSQIVKISNKNSLETLSGVLLESNGKSILSNSKGIADISIFTKGEINLSLLGYKTLRITYDSLAASGKVAMTENSIQTNEVVISASKFETEENSIAQQVEIISAKEIAFANQQSTADLLQNSGKILVQKSQQGGGSPIIRGFEANKVLLVIDGVRLNNAIYRAGHLQNVISMDQLIFERTEIVFGPGSVIYGSDALGGVMHFYSRDPLLSNDSSFINKTTAFARYSTGNNEFTEHVDFSVGTRKFGSLTSISISDFGDLRQGAKRNSKIGNLGLRDFYQARVNSVDSMLKNEAPNIQTETGFTQYDVLQKFLFKQNEKISHLVNFQYSTSSDVPRYDRLTEVDSNNTFKNAQWYYGPQKRLLLSYQLRLKGAGFYDQGTITLAMQNIEESRHNRGWKKSNLNHRIEKVNVYSINADFKKKLKSHEFDFGLEANRNTVASKAYAEDIFTQTRSALDTRYPDGGSNMHTIAAFLTHSQNISSKLILLEGLRISNVQLNAKFIDKTFFPFPYDQIEQNASALNGNIGLIYNPGADWRIALSFATGFRAANVDDISKVFESNKGDTSGNSSSIGTIIIPNPDLAPEKTKNFEISISKTIAYKIKFEGTAFYTLLTDAIVTQNASFNGATLIPYGDTLSLVQQNVNAAKANIYGLYGGVDWAINRKFTFSSSLTYTSGRITSNHPNTPLDHIAPLFGKTSLAYRITKCSAEFYMIYNGAKKIKDYNIAGEDNFIYATSNGLPAWSTINIRASYYFNESISCQLAVENLTDRNYRIFGSGISAVGRNIIISLKGDF